jgi:glyoxylate reductase
MAAVLVTRRIFPEAIALLERSGLSCRHHEQEIPLLPADLRDALASARALIASLGDRVDGDLLDAGPALEIVANVAVGHDNIDLDAATARGIVVTNTPDVLTETTADLAFALLLACARRIPEADRFMRAARFRGWELFQPLLGADVHGRTLGIVGMGRIGLAVARRGALGFGMQVLYVSRQAHAEAERELGARRVELDSLLAESDFVSLHLPLTPETRGMFTLREFARMKRTAFLVNTARGGLIVEGDLVQALTDGLIQGAGLDVFEDEPRMHPGLAKLEAHLVVAPHLGSATVDTRRRMAMTAAENVVAALAGSCPPNALNPEAWPARRRR